MKHTLLATTALVAMTGAAAAELTITATGRIGFTSTEGTALKAATTGFNKVTTAANATVDILGAKLTTVTSLVIDTYNITESAVAITAAGTAASADDITALDLLINEAKARVQGLSTSGTPKAGNVGTVSILAEQAQIATDIATLEAIRASLIKDTAKVAATADSTDAANRFRINFAGSGETDSGISYGISGRAEQSDSTLLGSQYISGAFGKISMGDLGGADKDATGNISGVGLTGLGDHNEVTYQGAAGHNIGYEYSTAGLTFGYSQDTAVKTGSNSAMGLKYSGDLGGATVSVGVGQSKVGVKTQNTISVSATTGGLTLKAISSTNDNGPAVKAADGTTRSAKGSTTAFVMDTLAAANSDTDTTGVSISYSMDAMTVTGFTKTVSTLGSADMDYSGFGFAYDMGGVTLKAGVVDNNDQQLIDLGLSFSF
jgi:outer membrane protein OmpU